MTMVLTVLMGEAPHMNPFTHPYHSESSVDSMEALMYDDQGPFVNALINPGQRLQNAYNEPILSWYTPNSSPQYATPREKSKSLLDLNQVSSNAWREKDINQWETIDTLNWIIEETSNCGLNYEKISMKGLSVPGHILNSMTEGDFVRCDPEVGSMLYHSFQRLRYNRETHFNYSMSSTYYNGECFSVPSFNHFKSAAPDDGLSPLEPMVIPVESAAGYTSNLRIHTSDAESDVSEEKERVKPRANRVGRPPGQKSKKKPEKKCGRLWEFIRDLLLNKEYCPSLICWENYEEGVFRFVRSDKVAELWGTIKDNPKMTYEKLSRAMRNYYSSRILVPVPKTGRYPKKLVYKFGPAAIWRPASKCGDGQNRVLLQEQSTATSSRPSSSVQVWPHCNWVENIESELQVTSGVKYIIANSPKMSVI